MLSPLDASQISLPFVRLPEPFEQDFHPPAPILRKFYDAWVVDPPFPIFLPPVFYEYILLIFSFGFQIGWYYLGTFFSLSHALRRFGIQKTLRYCHDRSMLCHM